MFQIREAKEKIAELNEKLQQKCLSKGRETLILELDFY